MAWKLLVVTDTGRVLNERKHADLPDLITSRQLRPKLVCLCYGNSIPVAQHFLPHQEPLYQRIAPGRFISDGVLSQEPCHLLGWTSRVGGRLFSHYAYCFENHCTVLGSQLCENRCDTLSPKLQQLGDLAVPDQEFTWVAVHADGSVTPQATPTGGRSFNTISRDKLQAVMLVDRGRRVRLVQYFEPGQRAIYRRRCSLSVGMGAAAVRKPEIIHKLGWEQDVEGEMVNSMAYFGEQLVGGGHVRLNIGSYASSHPLFVRSDLTDYELAEVCP